jgi:NTP pyrophosphatase (non-canonical NTP hydrolase)
MMWILTAISSLSSEDAEMIDDIEEERVRFHWLDAPKHEYLEFRIYLSRVTEETVLEITDFATEKEKDDLKTLWDNQIKKLRHETGG